jgi:hypothetical protein
LRTDFRGWFMKYTFFPYVPIDVTDSHIVESEKPDSLG